MNQKVTSKKNILSNLAVPHFRALSLIFFRVALSSKILLGFHSVKGQSLAVELLPGVLNYQGDLRQEVFTLKDGRAALGIGVLAELSNRIGIRYTYMYGSVHADDKYNAQPQYYYRNLDFWSRIREQSVQLQVQIFNGERAKINPFLVGGIAYFHFNPYTFDRDGVRHYLQPLSTEGQGVIPGAPAPYSLRERSIPMGGGIRFTVTEKLSISWEITFRYTQTDYLDDVSTRYPDLFLLATLKGPKSAELSFRALELPGANPLFPNGFDRGIVRGNPGRGDWYYFSGFKIRYDIVPISLSGARERRVNRSRGSIDCPRW